MKAQLNLLLSNLILSFATATNVTNYALPDKTRD